MDASTDRLSATTIPPRAPISRQPLAERDERAIARFAEELVAKGKELEAGDRREPKLAAVGGRGQEKHGGAFRERDTLEDSAAVNPAVSEQTFLREAAPRPAAVLPRAPVDIPAHVEQIAAAIAELRGTEAQAVRVHFGKDSLLAEGALIVRDVQTGALAIRITGLNPSVSARRQSDLLADLRERLEARQLRATVSLDGAPPTPVLSLDPREA